MPSASSTSVTAALLLMTDSEQPYAQEAIRSVVMQTKRPQVIRLYVAHGNAWVDRLAASFPQVEVRRIDRLPPGMVRNLAAQEAATGWVAYMDGDDLWEPEKQAQQLKLINESTQLIGCDYYLLSASGERKVPAICRTIPSASTWLARRQLMLDCPFKPEWFYHADSLWWAHYQGWRFTARVPELLSAYRMKDTSLSDGTASKRRKVRALRMSSTPLLGLAVRTVMQALHSAHRAAAYPAPRTAHRTHVITQPMTTAPAPRRRILLSIFACSPEWGSEPGVGWRWAQELAQHHEVTVITHGYFREQIEPLGATPHLNFHWFTVPGVGGHPHTQLNSRAYYWLWQLTVRAYVKRLLARQPHDLIHHLTWGTYRFPSFLGGLGAPLVMGPVGGGEGAPSRMYRSWPWRERLFYGLRQLSITFSRWDPFVIWSMHQAACVLTKTRETRNALPRLAQAKAHEASEIGVASVMPLRTLKKKAGAPLHLLYAGRLLGGKGIPYVMEMMKLLHTRGRAVQLSVAGDGRLEDWVRQHVREWGLEHCVHLLGKVPRADMPALYDAADLLVFPSWHDSSGNVVTEALARGVPVMCLDLGGPRYAVNPHCAVIVPTHGLTEHGIARAMARHIDELIATPHRLAAMSAAATHRAHEMTWANQVANAYQIIAQQLGWDASPRLIAPLSPPHTEPASLCGPNTSAPTAQASPTTP